MARKKKISIKVKVPRPRNLITRALCSDQRFRGRVEKSKKKELPKFDWKKADLD